MKKVFVMCVVALPWLACSGDGGGGGDIPIGELSARLMDAVCGYEVRCGAYPDKETCAGVLSIDLQFVASVNAGKIKYDGHAAAACLDLYGSAGCSVSDGPGTSLGLAQSCQQAVKGTVADGGACLDSQECVSELCDQGSCAGAMCCLGTCQSRIALGGDCSNSSEACADPLYCRHDAVAGTTTCQEKTAAGQPCTSSDVCVPGRACNIDATTGKGICGTLPAEGQACVNYCDAAAAAFCDPATMRCQRRIAVGDTCVPGTAGCVPYANCDATTLKCIARAAAGGVCATSGDCVSGLSCDSGTCTALPDRAACP